MTARTKAPADLQLRPLEDQQLEMAHAMDAIDQALGNVGLTWSWLAQIVAGGVARHAQTWVVRFSPFWITCLAMGSLSFVPAIRKANWEP